MYDFRIRGKFQVWSENINQYGIYQTFLHVSLLELSQNNLNNPDVYPEPNQTSKMECFEKIVNS